MIKTEGLRSREVVLKEHRFKNRKEMFFLDFTASIITNLDPNTRKVWSNKLKENEQEPLLGVISQDPLIAINSATNSADGGSEIFDKNIRRDALAKISNADKIILKNEAKKFLINGVVATLERLLNQPEDGKNPSEKQITQAFIKSPYTPDGIKDLLEKHFLCGDEKLVQPEEKTNSPKSEGQKPKQKTQPGKAELSNIYNALGYTKRGLSPEQISRLKPFNNDNFSLKKIIKYIEKYEIINEKVVPKKTQKKKNKVYAPILNSTTSPSCMT
jgi:hypothetical protein